MFVFPNVRQKEDSEWNSGLRVTFPFFSSPQVNLDSYTREHTKENLQDVTRSCFELAQKRIHGLMEKDSYPRFLRSELYMDLVNQKKASSTSTSSTSS